MAPPARAEAIPPAIAPNINNLIQRNQSAAFSSGKVRPNHETNINIIARRTGKDVNSHTVLDGIITTIMATIQRINIIGSREGSRNRRRLKANQTGRKPPLPALTIKLSKYNVNHVALGVCKTGAEEAGVTEVRTSLSEKKFELWRLIFFFNDTATTEIYTLSLHDALPI